ncbi:MAG TPA: Clp protease N-terminal domain-containing protein [Acidimicrobiales bacterium]|nr:Clp protease N-terminal domain-containing protein [Acidimicrobiales bacterium]
MEDRLSDEARSVVTMAEDEARRTGSATVGTEHLLLGLLGAGENAAARLLMAAGATLDGGRSKVVELVGRRPEKPAGARLDMTDRARRTLERADRLSLRRRAGHLEPEHILASLLDVEGRAGQVLRGMGVDLGVLRQASAAAIAGEPEPGPTEAAPPPPPSCTGCGADLAGGVLAYRVIPVRGEDLPERNFALAYCSACGTPVGATALRSGPG